LAALSGVCAIFCAYQAREEFFPVASCHCSFVGQDFLAIGHAIKTYKINAGYPPTTAQGLDALINEPKLGPKPKRWVQVMKKMPTDGWGTPFRYTVSTLAEGGWRWELRSAGKDGVFGSSDDETFEDESDGALLSPDFWAEGVAESRPSY
jgi:general secretion pathway protein G